ncbi:MAG: LytR C-terminal domain-containing protein [Actinomycetota bacterium]|nr:LytR C-terminal domain-containing protein [Actinomycetota bacterium]
MSYVVESASSRRARRRRRTAITLLVVVAMLAGAFYVASSYARNRTAVPQAASCPTTSATASGTGKAKTPTKTPAKPTAKAPLPSQVTVNVYNATGRGGLAGDTARTVRARGFIVGAVANDPLKKPIAGTGELRYGPTGRAAATVAHSLLPSAKTVLDGRTDASVDLVLGTAFTALAPPAASLTPGC